MAKRSSPPRQIVSADPWRFFKAALILLAGAWVFFPALRGDWLWDDDILISQNPVVHSPDGLWIIWTRPDLLIDYFPLTVTVEWIEWHLFGSHTLGYHLTSLALHLTSALLVWRLLAKFGLRWAWLGGLIFAIHPVVVESVAWIAELKNTLSLPPFLLAMIFWIDFDERGRARDYLLSLALFLAALLCKTTMVTFPVVILLYAWWKRGCIGGRDLKASAPFFAVSLALGAVTFVFVHTHIIAREMPVLGGPLSRLALSGFSIAFYFAKCLVPVHLMPIYPVWKIDPPSPAQFLSWLVIAVILGGLWATRQGWGRHALLGLGFFLVMLLPFTGFVGGTYMRFSWVMDHIVYIPLLGVVGLVVAGLETLASRLQKQGRYGLIGFITVLLVLGAIESRTYAAIFVDRQAYWTYAAQQNPQAWPAHNNLATGFEQKGDFAHAMSEFDLALQANPDYYEALLNRGHLELMQGNLAPARADLDRATALEPDAAPPYFLHAVIEQARGNAAPALSDLRRFRELAPTNSNADYAALWIWILRSGQGEKADADHELSTTHWDADPSAWPSQNRRFLLGQVSESDYLQSAACTDPDVAKNQLCEAWYYVGIKRQLGGDKTGAAKAFQASLDTGKTDYFEYLLASAQIQVNQ